MSTTADPISPPSKSVIFLRRLLSSLVLWALVLISSFSGNKLVSDVVFLMIMLALTGLGLHEFYSMVNQRGLACFNRWGVGGGLLLMAGTFIFASGQFRPVPSAGAVNDFETGFLALFVLGACIRQFFSKTNTAGFVAISTTLLGLFYVSWLLNFVQKINFFPLIDGPFYVLYFILVTKCSDLGAYVVGSLVGKHKMIPRVSPGKTWEGFIGAIVTSTLVSLIFAHFGQHRLTGMTWVHATALGLILSVSAVLGDLIESLFKREAGVKDSGRFFPGIGGILDLLDSLLFNAPLMYLYLRYILT